MDEEEEDEAEAIEEEGQKKEFSGNGMKDFKSGTLSINSKPMAYRLLSTRDLSSGEKRARRIRESIRCPISNCMKERELRARAY